MAYVYSNEDVMRIARCQAISVYAERQQLCTLYPNGKQCTAKNNPLHVCTCGRTAGRMDWLNNGIAWNLYGAKWIKRIARFCKISRSSLVSGMAWKLQNLISLWWERICFPSADYIHWQVLYWLLLLRNANSYQHREVRIIAKQSWEIQLVRGIGDFITKQQRNQYRTLHVEHHRN